jgi:hypothetical protein
MTLQYVLRDKDTVGFILSAGPKGYRAAGSRLLASRPLPTEERGDHRA